MIKTLAIRLASTLGGVVTLALAAVAATLALAFAVFAVAAGRFTQPEAAAGVAVAFAALALAASACVAPLLGLRRGRPSRTADPAATRAALESGMAAAGVVSELMLGRRAQKRQSRGARRNHGTGEARRERKRR